jgi:MoaA/NifB/PqqE/SkfB family radical SAM enzyme
MFAVRNTTEHINQDCKHCTKRRREGEMREERARKNSGLIKIEQVSFLGRRLLAGGKPWQATPGI